MMKNIFLLNERPISYAFFQIIGELLVIEEFCRYGNIHDYLIANRDSFVNELDEITGELKPLDEIFIQPHKYQTQNQYKRFFSFLIRSIFIRNSAYYFHFSYF